LIEAWKVPSRPVRLLSRCSMLTVRQAAAQLGCSEQLVYRLVESRQLAHFRVGLGRGKIAISESDVATYLASRRVDVTRQDDGATTPNSLTRTKRALKYLSLD
ncbi:MAG: helix-turn-helix domain-containing protein, partial [Candidatus Udaeobacter sp.]